MLTEKELAEIIQQSYETGRNVGNGKMVEPVAFKAKLLLYITLRKSLGKEIETPLIDKALENNPPHKLSAGYCRNKIKLEDL